MRKQRSTSKLDARGVERALERLREHVKREGLRASDVREAVARAALEMDGHFDVEALRARLPDSHFSTIYRTLPVLMDAGLLRSAPKTGEGQYYERAFERSHHQHLLCIRCGSVVEFQLENIEQIEENAAKRFNFAIVHREHHLFGLCKTCRRPPKN